jgi:hypothetical protein
MRSNLFPGSVRVTGTSGHFPDQIEAYPPGCHREPRSGVAIQKSQAKAHNFGSGLPRRVPRLAMTKKESNDQSF